MNLRLPYNCLAVPVMRLGFVLVAPFIDKVKRGIKERAAWKMRLANWAEWQSDSRPTWMFHAASVGELEAIRPVIARIVKRGHQRVVVTVFSPSVSRKMAEIPGVEAILNLPFDSLSNQRFLMDKVQPRLVVITKHDVWPNLLLAAREQGAHTALINANFHARSLRVHPIFAVYNRWIYSLFDGIATVALEHSARLKPFLCADAVCAALGDSRYDRVLERAGRDSAAVVEKAPVLKDRLVLVAGSTHPTEEKYLVPVVAELAKDFPKLFVIWVPHDPEPQALANLEKQLHAHRMTSGRWLQNPVLDDLSGVVVDETGILPELYSLGDIAVVGGGFDKGVHSVIEPAAAGLPVLFGPRYHVSQEASYLLDKGGGVVFKDRLELAGILRSWLTDPDIRQEAGLLAKSVVDENLGASERIVGFLDGIVSGAKHNIS